MNRIKELRELYKKTQKEMAGIIGVSHVAFGKYENKGINPKPENAKKTCRIF